MKNRLIAALAALASVVLLSLVPTAPASAQPDTVDTAAATLAAAEHASVATPATVDHATSNEANWSCAVTMPTGIGTPPDDILMHAHLYGIGIGFRRYSCESWNFKTGAASNGCQWLTLYVDGVGPFGPEPTPTCY